MKFKSEVVTQASGSVGGVTYSHNRGGMYRRARSIPTDPATPEQVAARNAFGNLSQQWGQVLTAAQRAAWDLYAANVQVTDVLGDPINLTGQQWFVKANQPRVLADATNLPVVADGPTIFNRAQLNTLSILAASEATQTILLAYDDTQSWDDTDDAGLIVSVSRPKSPTINFFKGPYRYVAPVLGDSTTPPSQPATIVPPFPFVQGDKLFLEAKLSLDDGRLSQTQRLSVTAGA